MRTREKHQEPLPNTTHDRDCTNAQNLSKRSTKNNTPASLYRAKRKSHHTKHREKGIKQERQNPPPRKFNRFFSTNTSEN